MFGAALVKMGKAPNTSCAPRGPVLPQGDWRPFDSAGGFDCEKDEQEISVFVWG